MKTKFLFILVLVFSQQIIYAQVGIGTTDPKASLDISSSNLTNPSNTDGILIPRIDDFPSTNPSSEQDGMMVFVTGSGTPIKGFYYWNQSTSTWISITGAKQINDLVDGKSDNDGSNDGSSLFLGIDAGANDDSTHNFNVGIGFEALQSNISSWGNTAIGYQAMQANTIGMNSTATGANSLTNNLSGTNNSAFGNGTLSANTSGSFNSAIGQGSLNSNIDGNYNIALGYWSLLSNTSGSQNVALGSSAGYTNSAGNNNVFIGYQSGYFETGSEKLYIENSNADSNNALIYGEFDNNILRTNGEFQIGNPVTTGYALPLTDGSNNQVMTTDGLGNLSFQDIVGDGDTQNTLDDAYNEGGVGAGKNINATNGAVRINGTDGFLVTGTLGSGSPIDTEITGAGSRMFFNPNKVAFRSGAISGNHWDNANIGLWSIGFGVNTIASGTTSSAFGSNTIASGNTSTAFGVTTVASGSNSTAFGQITTASGNASTSFGVSTVSSGTYSFASGSFNTSPSFSETVIGSYATEYTPVSSGSFNAGDKLFVIGNGTSNTNRGNALTIYKSGLMNINDAYNMPSTDGTLGQVLTTDGAGNVSFQNIIGDGTGTDNQNLTTATLTGTTLNLGIQNGTGTSINLASLANDNDWTTVGANIERQNGDVYIGNTNATNNDIYISNNIIDWDNTNYYLNPDDMSVMDEIQFDNGTAADPSILFQDINTGFFSPSNAVTAYSANGNESFRIQNDGEISIGLTGATNYKFSLNSLVNQNTIRIGNDVSSTDNFVDIYHSAQRGNAMNISVNDSYSLASRSGISVFNELGDTNVEIAKYATGSSNIYGLEIYIPEDIVGTEYGVYSNVLTTNGYAAYFLGEVSLGTTTGNTYILPNSRGTNGQVMQTDGVGNVTWQNPTINSDNQQIDNFSFNSSTNELTLEIEDDGQPVQTVDLSSLNPAKAIARLFMSASQTETGSGITKVNFDSTDFDIGNNFNTTSEEFVVPQTGIYRVTAQITMDASTGTGTFDVRIRVNGTQQRRAEYNHTGNGQIVRQVTSIISLNAGDTIDVAFARPGIGATIQANSRASFFEIEQL